MAKVITGMTMSINGFINDRKESVERLYSDFSQMHDVASFQEIINNTGAVIMGKRAFAMGATDSWGDYEFQTPIFVLTHTPPDKPPIGNDKLSFTFVADGITSAIAQAKIAAGDKDVQIVGGASTVQQSLNSGLCDELSLDIVPVLLGGGQRLFENIATNKIRFEKIKIEEINPVRTGFTFKVVHR